MTITPSFEGCTCLGVACTIDTNGCDFVVRIGTPPKGTVDLVCPEGKEMTLTSSKCTIHVKPQTGIGAITYKDLGAGTTREIELNLELLGIHYSHTEGTGIGRCVTGTGSTGTLWGTLLVTAEEDLGPIGHVGLWVE